MVGVPTRETRTSQLTEKICTLWRAYLRQLRDHPLRTKSLTSAIIFALSDALSQAISHGGPFSVPRNALVAGWGLVWAGPSAHVWQAAMERLSSRRDIAAVLLKVTIDQLTYGPCNNLMNMAFFSLLVESNGVQHAVHKLLRDFPAVQRSGWRLWPAAAMFNYRFVPLPLRVLFLNCVALVWTTFLNFWTTRGASDGAGKAA